MKVTESSESVLAGTKRPPFRMVVRAVGPDGTRLNIRPAVSEEFVVVTKRTKNLKKQEIPSLDDPISKLNHIGKETVKKLNEIKASADEMNLDLKLPQELWRYCPCCCPGPAAVTAATYPSAGNAKCQFYQ